MKKYVLGFAFDGSASNVVLIHKQTPSWQKGLWNGVGGKVEDIDYDEGFAMCREFEEETGVSSFPETWTHFATMRFDQDIMGGQAELYCFKCFSDNIFNCKTVEEEEIKVFRVGMLPKKKIEHVQILIDLALTDNINFVNLSMK